MRRILGALAVLTMSTTSSLACEAARVMFGNIELQIIQHQGYESALVRHADFKDPKQLPGAMRGEVTVDRGGFAIRNTNTVVVGVISPTLQLEGWDDSCDKRSKIMLRKVQPGVYVIMSDDTPVGTIKGRFPKNGFGVN